MQQFVGTPQNKVVDQCRKRTLRSLALFANFFWCVGLAAVQDGVLIDFSELLNVTKDPRVGKVNHREELFKVILHGSSRKQHTPLAWKTGKRHISFSLVVFEAVCLIADDQFRSVDNKSLGMEAESVIADDQHRWKFSVDLRPPASHLRQANMTHSHPDTSCLHNSKSE